MRAPIAPHFESSRPRLQAHCRIPGCSNEIAPELSARISDGFCPEHLLLASERSRRLLYAADRRLARLERSWDDQAVFNAIVARGRYLAFCMLLKAAQDRVERTWRDLAAEVFAGSE
jgi:hypothetical protein